MLMIRKQSISDYDEEKAGYHFNIEREDKEMYLKFLKKTTEVRQLSNSDANTLVGDDPETLVFLAPAGDFPALKRQKRVTPKRTPEPWGRAGVCIASFASTDICSQSEQGPIPAPSAGGFVVVAPATGHGVLRTNAKSLKIGSGMFHYTTLAKWVAEQTYRTKYEGMTFGSKYYPETIHDQSSFDAWLSWKLKRPTGEHVLWVVG
jgi:hypothetical protein